MAVEVAGEPAGVKASRREAALTVRAPSLAARLGKACAALLISALRRVTAAKVDCEGVAETVLSGGNWTEAFKAKFATVGAGVKVTVTTKGCTACWRAVVVSLIRSV